MSHAKFAKSAKETKEKGQQGEGTWEELATSDLATWGGGQEGLETEGEHATIIDTMEGEAMMKKRMAVWLAAAGLAATAAWGQDLVGSVEVRGLQDFLDTAMALVAETPAEGSPAMLPALLQPQLGVNVLEVVEPHGTIRFDLYEKDGADEPTFRLSLPVADPDAFFGKLAETWTEAEAAEGEEAPAFRKFTRAAAGLDLAFRGEPGRVCVMPAENADAALLAKEAEPALDVAGALAVWVNPASEFMKQLNQGDEMQAVAAFEEVALGLGLPDRDKLEFNFLMHMTEKMAADLPDGETGPDVNLVNLPGAVLAVVEKCGRTNPQDLDWVKQLAAARGLELPEAFWSALVDVDAEFAGGDAGMALLPDVGDGFPKFAAYLTPKNPGEARQAIRDNATACLDKLLEGLGIKEEGGDSPMQLVPGEARTAAGAEIDVYGLVLADAEVNREMAAEKGWTLPKEIGTIDVAWLDNGAMVLSTLGGDMLDGLLERRAGGAMDDFAAGGPYAEMFGAGERSLVMSYIRLVPFMRFVLGKMQQIDPDFGADEILSALPEGDVTMAFRGDLAGERRFRESIRVNLPELKEFVMAAAAQMGNAAGSGNFEDEDDFDEEEIDFEFEEEAEEIDFDAEEAAEDAAGEAAVEAADEAAEEAAE